MTEQQEREAFEKWYCDFSACGFHWSGMRAIRHGDWYGDHRPKLNDAWEVWKARAALPSADEPMAWLDSDADDVISAARKTLWMRHDGGYRLIAEKYTVPLYAHQPAATSDAISLAELDAAFEKEIARVSHVEYDSNEICRHFFGEIRKSLIRAQK